MTHLALFPIDSPAELLNYTIHTQAEHIRDLLDDVILISTQNDESDELASNACSALIRLIEYRTTGDYDKFFRALLHTNRCDHDGGSCYNDGIFSDMHADALAPIFQIFPCRTDFTDEI